ncbi:hypothetical protein BJ742DRAFT_784466 [Cladochytrium replicatum]|nr:hypothetical protein BJ742DRAFT_784466 [Cladochytrium replicatum]
MFCCLEDPRLALRGPPPSYSSALAKNGHGSTKAGLSISIDNPTDNSKPFRTNNPIPIRLTFDFPTPDLVPKKHMFDDSGMVRPDQYALTISLVTPGLPNRPIFATSMFAASGPWRVSPEISPDLPALTTLNLYLPSTALPSPSAQCRIVVTLRNGDYVKPEWFGRTLSVESEMFGMERDESGKGDVGDEVFERNGDGENGRFVSVVELYWRRTEVTELCKVVHSLLPGGGWTSGPMAMS